MKGFKLFTISSIVILFGLVIYIIGKEKNIAFIDTAVVFNEFKMTAAVDKELKEAEKAKGKILDSLIDILKQADAGILKLEANKTDFLKKEYAYKNKQFTQELETMKQSGIEKIWKQINQYISDYSKEKNYLIILGANGQGSLMYANEQINVTKEVSEYINEKFNGKN